MVHENIKFIELQKIDLTYVELPGRILDIGGGGEAIIGLLKGELVVAIDRRKSELENAPSGDHLNIIMDATDLKFLDESFDTATAFFTIMYVPLENRQKIFQEIHRVLKKGGEFVVWDFPIPKREGAEQEFYGLYLEVKIRKAEISTGFASKWDKEQDLEYFANLGTSNGFSVVEKYPIDGIFYIRFKKE